MRELDKFMALLKDECEYPGIADFARDDDCYGVYYGDTFCENDITWDDADDDDRCIFWGEDDPAVLAHGLFC